ncbi:alpha/beta fold hydrolase [Aestuariibacter sp. AA17]|uniref:Alpha/beta fold hydrolase n=1 Tax=Fluctibacter corallii TaxID=2984329 RepID=A0ABT3A5K9_9ALTE|nr:alpha/beta fold hydrolase [Aestuariibacter sp. AA17]MCV2883939.1 alpha/beta fold hydrolase [Aestuariibacter sp. AA17]
MTLHYQISHFPADEAHADGQSRAPLVLIHGLFGSLENLALVRREFESERSVISIDLPDHGKSTHSNTFSFSDYAKQIVELLDSLSFDSYILLGHSLGGKVAMQVALEGAIKIERLIVADIAPVAYEARHQSVFQGLNNVDLTSINTRSDADAMLAECISETGVRQFLLKSLYQENGQWQWRFNLPMLERNYDTLSGALPVKGTFDNPVLFVKGGRSDYIKPAYKERILALFPNSQAKVIGSAGHWLHAEKPAAFNHIVRNFIND